MYGKVRGRDRKRMSRRRERKGRTEGEEDE